MPVTGKTKPFWIYLIGIDLILVFMTAFPKHLPALPYSGYFLAPFDLAAEMNIAVWWSGMTLALAGFIAYEIFCEEAADTRFAWLALSVILLGLSLDEIGSLHERVGSWSRFVPFAFAICGLLLFSFLKLWMDAGTRRAALLVLAGFSCFGLTALQEYIEHAVSWPHWTVGLRVALEEGTELLGTLLILLGVVPHRKRDGASGSVPASLASIIPDPSGFKGLAAFLFLGTGIGAAVSLFVYPSLSYNGRLGNPAIWYPAILYLLVSFALFREARKTETARPAIPYSLSVLFLLSSVYCVFPLFKLFPVIGAIVPYRILLYSGLYILQLAAMGVYQKERKPLSVAQTKIYWAFVTVTLLSLFTRDLPVKLMILTIASSCTTLFFVNGLAEGEAVESRRGIGVPETVPVQEPPHR